MTLLIYSLIAGAILSLLWGAFKLSGLARMTHFGLNRAVLVATLLLSLGLPFVAFRPVEEAAEVRQVGQVGLVEQVEFVEQIEFIELVEPAEPAFDWAPVRSAAVTVYLIGAAACALWMLLGFTGVVIAIASGRREGNNLIVHRRNISPFAWGRWIVISERDCANQAILRHESAHLRAAHWLDLLLSRAATCLLWYWPTAWLLNRDLCQAHEFEADRAVLNSGVAPAEYQLMLVGAGSGRLFSNIVNPFNFYSLKHRIAMMKMKKSPAGSRMRVLAMLPAAAVAALLASAPALASTVSNYLPEEEVKVTEIKIVDDDAVQAQTDNDNPQEIFYTAEKMPQFPGGEMDMYKWLSRHIVYPEEAAKKDIQGRVMVQFVVEKDGSIGPVKIFRGVDPLLDTEAVRVVKTLPKFTPGTMNGEPVRVWFTMPLMFKLQGDPKPGEATEEKADKPTIYMRTHKPEPGKNPLYLLDGVPVEASVLANMSQEDIDSIRVRKDEAFTSQYGEAGKYGVIVITTKKAGDKTKSTRVVKATASRPAEYVGQWKLVSENGKPQSAQEKIYYPDGNFVVGYNGDTKRNDKGYRSVKFFVAQRGSWEVADNGKIIEHCTVGKKGDVVITSSIDGNTMTQTFSYASNPDVKYVQKFEKISNLDHMKTDNVQTVKMRNGVSITGTFSNDVVIIGGEHVTLDDFRNFDGTKVECVAAIKDSSASKYMTPEEIAAGKTGVILVTLKKDAATQTETAPRGTVLDELVTVSAR